MLNKVFSQDGRWKCPYSSEYSIIQRAVPIQESLFELLVFQCSCIPGENSWVTEFQANLAENTVGNNSFDAVSNQYQFEGIACVHVINSYDWNAEYQNDLDLDIAQEPTVKRQRLSGNYFRFLKGV